MVAPKDVVRENPGRIQCQRNANRMRNPERIRGKISSFTQATLLRRWSAVRRRKPSARDECRMQVNLVAVPSWFRAHVGEDRVTLGSPETVQVRVLSVGVGCDVAEDPPSPPLICRPCTGKWGALAEVVVVFGVLAVVEEQDDVFACWQTPQARTRLASF